MHDCYFYLIMFILGVIIFIYYGDIIWNSKLDFNPISSINMIIYSFHFMGMTIALFSLLKIYRYANNANRKKKL